MKWRWRRLRWRWKSALHAWRTASETLGGHRFTCSVVVTDELLRDTQAPVEKLIAESVQHQIEHAIRVYRQELQHAASR